MKKLVGQGKPFHSAVDKAAGMLKRKVGTGAEFMKELMGITGIKPTEIQERGLNEVMGMPRMTHDQFMAALASKPAPAIEEKVFANKLLRNPGSEPDPHHEKWTLPGGDNYREMLIKAPKGIDNQEKIMELDAKIRHTPMFNSTPQQQADIAKYYNQIKELKAQEAASPKPFQGVPHHFGGEPGILASMRLKDRTGPNGEKLLHLEELQSDWHQQGREHGYELNSEEQQKQFAGWPGVPDAPFKKNWEEVALKRLIHHAAEKGYHGIVVTPGAEQADRYSLAKYIDSIMLVPNPHPNANSRPYYYKAFNKEGHRVADDTVDEQSLAQHIGKEAAEKLLAQEPNPMGERMISGANLVTGGEGMKAFYDKKVPNILNGIGRKYGVKTQLHGHQVAINNGMLEPQQGGGYKQTPPETKAVHHFPITEEMRKDVLANGLPLYAGGGEVDAEEVFMGKGGKVKEPKSTVKAYKLFRVDERHPGKLFPLFVNANQPVEMNKWVNAEVGPQTDKGKVKSKLGPLAYRPGWHSGDLPVATHIGEGGAPPTHRPRNHAWAEVEVPNDVDWQTEANKRGINKQGKLIAREAHITDQIPKGGHYRYKTNPNMTGNWLISGSMKVNKVLSHPEVERINKKAGVSDLPRKEPFNKKDFGFKYGGDVDVESYFFPNKE